MLIIDTTYKELSLVSVGSDAIRNRRSLAKKIGNITGKGVLFFKRQETKTATLVSLWSLETFATLIVILAYNSFFIPTLLIFLHIYSSYCLFSTINAVSAKTNG